MTFQVVDFFVPVHANDGEASTEKYERVHAILWPNSMHATQFVSKKNDAENN